MRWKLAVVALLVMITAVLVGRAEGQARPAVQQVGRWQIVHGPPQGLYRTFLIGPAAVKLIQSPL